MAKINIFFFICGISSFLIYFLFDYLEYKGDSLKYKKLLGYLSAILLLISVIGLIKFSPKWKISLLIRIISAIFSVFTFYFLFKALFVEVSFYKDSGEKMVESGSYSLCRHPGVVLLFIMLILLFLATGSVYLLYGAFLFSGLNLLIALFEDRIFLPYKFEKYVEYKKVTPFLFPKTGSILKVLKNWFLQ